MIAKCWKIVRLVVYAWIASIEYDKGLYFNKQTIIAGYWRIVLLVV